MALADRAELAVRLTLDDRAFTGGIRRAQTGLSRFGSSAGRIGRGVGQVGAGLARAGTILGTAVVGGLALATREAIKYEDAFAGVRKTVNATDPELDALSLTLRDMATRIPIAATEFARLGEIGGALGIDVSRIDEFVEVTAKLGVATDLSADQAADALGRIGNILNLTEQDYAKFGSALVRLGNEGASTEAEIIDITRRFGAAGKKFGLTTAEILGLAEATASFSGLQPERAGSSLVRLIEGLTLVVAKGGEDFESLNKLVGTDFKKAIEQDASGAVTLFLDKISELDQFEQLAFLRDLGISGTGLSQLLGGLSANVEDIDKSFANADAGWQGNFLNLEAEEKFKAIAQRLQLLKNNVIEAAITFGTELLPAIGRAADKMIEFLRRPDVKSEIQEFGRSVGQFIDDIDWQAVERGARDMAGILKSAADWALTIVKAISLLPKEFLALGAGFAGLNKLSGGLIGAGFGNILGGLGEVAARSVGSRLPGGIGKLFAQPVFVTNWPPGVGLGGGGAAVGAKGALSLASKVFLVGEAIGLALLVKEVADNVTGAAREQAQTIGQTLDRSLRQPNTLPELQTKLAGIQYGIDEINRMGNIPAALFHDTLVELEGQRDRVLAEIQQMNRSRQRQPFRRDAAGDKAFVELQRKIDVLRPGLRNVAATVEKKGEAQRAALARMRERIEANRIALVTSSNKEQAKLLAVRAGVAIAKVAQIAAAHNDTARIVSAVQSVAGAVRALDLSVSVNVDTTRVYKTGQTIIDSGGTSKRRAGGGARRS